MRKSRFTETQIIGMIKEQQAGLTVAEVCRKHGISPASFYKLKAKYGGMDVSDARRLKQLEEVEPLRRHWFEPNGEGQAQAAGGRYDAGCCRAEGPSGKALTTSAQRREAALKAMRDGDCERQWFERAGDENLAAPGLRPGWCRSQDRAARKAARSCRAFARRWIRSPKSAAGLATVGSG